MRQIETRNLLLEIKFSRHAKRRMQLYNISELILYDILKDIDLHKGKHEIVRKIPGVHMALKVVIVVEEEIVTIITAYPLKKRKIK